MPNKQVYWERKEMGLCTACGKRDTLPDSTRCEECFVQRLIASHRYNHEHREEKKKYMKRWKRKKIKEGICVKCGSNEADEGSKYCVFCKAGVHEQRGMRRLRPDLFEKAEQRVVVETEVFKGKVKDIREGVKREVLSSF